jgi:aspartyl aminopeptidase
MATVKKQKSGKKMAGNKPSVKATGVSKTKKCNEGLLRFIVESPNAYFAVREIGKLLDGAGFERLTETEKWDLKAGKAYYVTRDESSVIAFRTPKGRTLSFDSFQIVASHTDSPTFKVKPDAEMTAEDAYIKLNTEKYGGMILYSWLDRPLSVAGRIALETKEGIRTRLVKIDRDLLVIPSLAIHMDRTLNDGYSFNPQKDMLPLFAQKTEDGADLMELVAREAGVKKEEILDADLYLYSRVKGSLFGAEDEFVGSGRLDDLQCAYASVQSLIGAQCGKNVAVCAVFNNEEVGSSTKQGAASSFLETVLGRIASAAGMSEEEKICALSKSFLISADNAHAVHPNHADKADPTNRPKLNGGIVIKYNANQKYTSDAVSGAAFKKICKKAGVPVQTYVNRSDIAGGSTLGSIAVSRVSMHSVDIGLPQLAMHSAYETAGSRDTRYLVRALETFYGLTITAESDGLLRME